MKTILLVLFFMSFRAQCAVDCDFEGAKEHDQLVSSGGETLEFIGFMFNGDILVKHPGSEGASEMSADNAKAFRLVKNKCVELFGS